MDLQSPPSERERKPYVVIVEDHDQQTLDCARVETTGPINAVILAFYDYLAGFGPRALKSPGIWQYEGKDGKGITDDYRVTVLEGR